MKQDIIHEETVKNLIDGDSEAFSEIYLTLFEPLCRFAFRFFPNKDEATGIVQDVMIKMWEKRKSLKEVSCIENYLYRATYNACVNKIERLKVADKYINHTRLRLLEIEMDDYATVIDQWEMQDKLNSEIGKLPPQGQKVFTMRYLEGLSYKDIAEKLNISARTVESHIQESIKCLRKKLKGLL
jgi:RNA polymerase sigma-70 factor (ECF subfamily)